ncbi:MAG: hypothetical protein QXU40_00695 [Candidatus Pacearchaeota archaeon]
MVYHIHLIIGGLTYQTKMMVADNKNYRFSYSLCKEPLLFGLNASEICLRHLTYRAERRWRRDEI